MKRVKVGKGFWQSGYGRKSNNQALIYLINNKYYAKSKRNADTAYDGDLLDKGYVCVNADSIGEVHYSQCHLSDHETVKSL